MTDYKIIQTINGPEDVKKLSMEQLEELASEIREALFNRLTKIGGHFGPNFGMVEAEIAMHYVFSSPKDKFIFDVSHQSYPHKILTGRKNGYISDEHFSEDSGYTNPEESEHDFFNVGHTSTSVSLATGLAKARDIKGDKENIIAIIGDGSLSGGEALEGLNVAGSEINSNLIIIVNDNEQSIAEVHGGMYKNLAELRETGGTASNNLFKAFGLDYIYEENGNDIASLISLFRKVKDTDHPIVVHIHTTFIQRAYDQISHDVCINNSSVTILLNYNSFDSLTDVTHLGIFGLAAYTNVPNLVVLAPTSKDEYLAMLDWSVDQKEHPVMILIPGNQVTYREADKDFNRLNHFKVEEAGEKVAILALGDFYQRGEQLSAKIKAELGFTPTLINPRFASGIDKELLESLSERHQMVITMEDGILSGGFGEKIASFYGSSDMKVKNYGLDKKFYDRYDPNELLKEVGMTPVQIIADICNQIK